VLENSGAGIVGAVLKIGPGWAYRGGERSTPIFTILFLCDIRLLIKILVTGKCHTLKNG